MTLKKSTRQSGKNKLVDNVVDQKLSTAMFGLLAPGAFQ